MQDIPLPARRGRAAVGAVVAVAALLAGLVGLLPTLPVAADDAADPPEDPPAGSITVTQAPDEEQTEDCVPGPDALSRSIDNGEEAFTLVITSQRPCSPITAHAVAYAMPGFPVAWPQTLVEKQTFVIDFNGTTTVSFAKGCDPVQFDVVTGATPDTITPVGPFHGPLLFPFDTATALQWWGSDDCEPPPPPPGDEVTTTTTTTTTSTTTTTTSTPPTGVKSTTSTSVPTSAPTTSPPPTGASGSGTTTPKGKDLRFAG
jgi:hypothetical protein